MKRPIVIWDGATKTEPNQWTVKFILERADGSKESYWYLLDAAPPIGDRIDVNEANFWYWAAYEGAKAIEAGRLLDPSTGELLIIESEILDHRHQFPQKENPAIGDVVRRFGSPPYD